MGKSSKKKPGQGGKGKGNDGGGQPDPNSTEEMDKRLQFGVEHLDDDYETPPLKLKLYNGSFCDEMVDQFADTAGDWDNPLIYSADADDVTPILKQFEVSQSDRKKQPSSSHKSPYEKALGKKKLPPNETWAEPDAEGWKFGFNSQYETWAVRTFLWEKGRMTMRPSTGDGNCMLNAIVDQIQFQDEAEKERFDTIYLRRMAVMHFLEHRGLLYADVTKEIRDSYGLVEDQNNPGVDGPFTLREYLKFMLKDGKYCDGVMIKLLASMWSVRIAVVRSDCCAVLKFRTDLNIDKCQFVLVYNCSWYQGHYSSVNKEKVPARHISQHKKFDKARDHQEKEDRALGTADASGFIMVSREKLKQLMRADKQLRNLKRSLGASGEVSIDDPQDDTVTNPSGKRRYKPHKEKNVQEVEMDKVHCDKCDKDFPGPAKLQRHLNIEHHMEYEFVCETCGKALQSKEGLKSHKATHDESLKIPCPKCTSTFTSKKSLKTHLKWLHPSNKKAIATACSYCKKVFKYKALALQHEKGCDANENQEFYKCTICGQGGFKWKKKLRDHKRRLHHWLL